VQKLILLILVGVWAAVLVPPALRSRVQGRPGDSISDFNRRLDILGRTRNTRRSAIPRIGTRAPRTVAPYRTTTPLAARTTTPLVTRSATPALRVAAPMSPAARRRRDVFVFLLVAVAVTFIAAVWRGGLLWVVQLGADLALAGYVYLLVQMRNAAAQRRLAYPPLRGVVGTSHDGEPESRLHLVRAASRVG
jgi:hypothetical protein